MRVIQNNNTTNVVCPHCRSVLEIIRSDIQGQDRQSRTYRGGIAPITVPCGACGKTISLAYDEEYVFKNESL